MILKAYIVGLVAGAVIGWLTTRHFTKLAERRRYLNRDGWRF